jgi:hypothetical protein
MDLYGFEPSQREKTKNNFLNGLESLGRGAVATAPGTFGDLEELGRLGINWASGRELVNKEAFLPTTADILRKIPRITEKHDGDDILEMAGGFIPIAPAVLLKNALRMRKVGEFGNESRISSQSAKSADTAQPGKSLTRPATGGDVGVYAPGSRGPGQLGRSDGRADTLSKEDFRSLVADPQANPAIQTARKINPEFNLDAVRAMPESSLRKQFPIGKTYDILTDSSGIDPDLKKQIFMQYLRQSPDMVRKSDATNYDELTEAAYKQLQLENSNQFAAMMDDGMRISLHGGDKNYLDSQHMLRDALLNKNLDVFQGGDPHKFLNVMDAKYGMNDNEKFRAVHDYFGHGTTGASFGQKGEEIAYGAHSGLFSPLAKLAAAAETRGQNSFVNYSGINSDIQKQMDALRPASKGATGAEADSIAAQLRDLGSQWQYAKQDGVILPPEMIDLQYRGGVPDYLRNYIKPKNPESAPGFHWSNSDNLAQTDPTKYGTGIKGAEASRLKYADEKDRTYFYTNPTSREGGLGANQYSASLENLYDVSQDKDKLGALSQRANSYHNIVDQESKLNDLERLIKESGYQGYLDPAQNAAVSFYPQDITKIK